MRVFTFTKYSLYKQSFHQIQKLRIHAIRDRKFPSFIQSQHFSINLQFKQNINVERGGF